MLKRELFFRIRDKTRLETGFSMLEAVVVVGVLLALAIGGFLSYGPIIKNAKLAKAKSAASEVYTAATVYQIDGDPQTKPQDALDNWNASSTEIKVKFLDTKIVSVPAMTTADYSPEPGEDFCIQATNVSTPEIQAKSGNCPEASTDVESPAEEVIPEPIPVPEDPSILKNGDFSQGLKYWTPTVSSVPSILPVVTDGEAVLTSGSDRPVTLTQTVAIPSSGITHLKYAYRLDASPNNVSSIRVNAYDMAGSFIKEIKKTTSPIGPAVPVTISTADVTEFAGQSIKLEFHYINGGYSDVRNAYLDNVSIENTTEVPGAPIDVKATVNVTDATITWISPVSGASSIKSYTVTPYRNGSPLAEITTTGAPPATSAVFRGITSGGDYTFTVTATNNLGQSIPSAPSEKYSSPAETLKNGDFSAGMTSWTPAGTRMPTISNGEAVLVSGSNTPATITQTVTIPSVGITHLNLSYRLDASTYNTSNIRVNVYDTAGTFIKEVKKITVPVGSAVPSTLATADFTEFAGRDIKMELHYTNGGFADTRNVYLDNISIQTVNREPDAPTAVKITGADTDATITWTSPLVGGSSVTSYTVTPYRNGSPLAEIVTTGTPPAKTAVFKGMTSGSTYTFTVKATNSLGTSGASVPSDPFLKPAKTLDNGDFSAGMAGWTPAGIAMPVVTAGEAVLTSGGNRVTTISQVVSIPSSGSTQLRYTYRLDSSQYNTSNIRVNVYNLSGTLLKEVKKTTFPTGAAVPKTTTTADLTEFAGQDVKVEFHYTNGAFSDARNSYFDNVSLVTG